jgi:hypothetical protein
MTGAYLEPAHGKESAATAGDRIPEQSNKRFDWNHPDKSFSPLRMSNEDSHIIGPSNLPYSRSFSRLKPTKVPDNQSILIEIDAHRIIFETSKNLALRNSSKFIR